MFEDYSVTYWVNSIVDKAYYFFDVVDLVNIFTSSYRGLNTQSFKIFWSNFKVKLVYNNKKKNFVGKVLY